MSADTYAGVKAVAADRKTTFLAAGKVVEPDTTIGDALRAAGMDWEVGLRPVTVDGKVVPNRKAVVRADTGHVFDIVGRGYTPIQTADALGVSDDLHREAGFKFVSCGELGEGRVTWVALEAPEGLTIGGQDAFGMTCLVETSHDGKRAVRMHIAPVRFACKNVTNLLIRNAVQRWAVPHTSKAPERLAEAHRAVGLVKGYEEALQGTAETLLAQPMTERQLTTFLTKLLPERPVKEKEVAAIRDLAVVAETNEFGRGTRYAALNAVREYYDHVRPQRTAESAFIGAMTGVNYRTTNRALELLLPAGAR